MRRLVRRTLYAFAVISLLLCLAAAGLWVRTYYRADELSHYRRLTAAPARAPRFVIDLRAVAHHFLTARGEVGVIIAEEFRPMEGASEWIHRPRPAQAVPLSPMLGRFGFYVEGWRRKPANKGQVWILEEL